MAKKSNVFKNSLKKKGNKHSDLEGNELSWNALSRFFRSQRLKKSVGLFLLLFSLLTSVLAYGFFNRGLQDVEASKASIVATAEVAMAVLWGVLFLQEGLVPWQLVGICMVLWAAYFIQETAVSKD